MKLAIFALFITSAAAQTTVEVLIPCLGDTMRQKHGVCSADIGKLKLAYIVDGSRKVGRYDLKVACTATPKECLAAVMQTTVIEAQIVNMAETGTGPFIITGTLQGKVAGAWVDVADVLVNRKLGTK